MRKRQSRIYIVSHARDSIATRGYDLFVVQKLVIAQQLCAFLNFSALQFCTYTERSLLDTAISVKDFSPDKLNSFIYLYALNHFDKSAPSEPKINSHRHSHIPRTNHRQTTLTIQPHPLACDHSNLTLTRDISLVEKFPTPRQRLRPPSPSYK